jgi:EAL domain-containing protein (putative c-di-GMP-specific phosphodiesterase class I)
MSLNLSALHIAMPSIVDHVAAALEYAGLAPASLIVEMTESVLVDDAETAGHRLEELRALGVRLAIDDFGTGYSSLAYLRKFPFDILKIDRSFTSTITDRAQVPAIVRGLLDLAKTLNMKTVAEGIELDAQRESLRDQGCDFGQGFLFAKPLRREQAEAFLARVLSGGSAAVETLEQTSRTAC